ncbi:MAG TPA: hypothetical protein VNB64_04335 [Solirubrobacteraceae bacterium]|nr:hypothetical protein [Solirubrobacteraceae bacterium]
MAAISVVAAFTMGCSDHPPVRDHVTAAVGYLGSTCLDPARPLRLRAPEATQARHSVRVLVVEFRADPDSRFVLDDSETETTTMRQLLTDLVDEFDGPPCHAFMGPAERALRDEAE